MTHIDYLASKAWSGYPSWVVRRLKSLHIRFALDNGEPGIIAIRDAYASYNYGDGRYLSQRHLEWLGHAWLCVGPQVQEPPLHRVPCIIGFLNTLRNEDSLLEGWLLSLASNGLRHRSWVEDVEDLRELAALLRGKQIRRYWEWLTNVIKIHCGDVMDMDGGDWQRHVVASRVASALYSDCHLSSLVRHVDEWDRFWVPQESKVVGSGRSRVAEHLMARSTLKWHRDIHAQTTAAHGRIQRFVPGIGNRDPALAIQDLWKRGANQ